MSTTRSKGWQAPIQNRKADRYDDLLRIATHPAFRLGFLDAQSGRPCNHDKIIDRIRAETPLTALKRAGWDGELICRGDVEKAQYRYEEGRFAVIEKGLRCRAWGHPDYPPVQLLKYIRERANGKRPQ